MLRHLIILFTICFCCSIYTFAETKDEDIHKIYAECENARSLAQYKQLELCSDKLIKLAKKEKNQRLETYGYFYNGLSKLFTGRGDESQKMHDIAEEMSTKIGNDSVKALVMNARGIYHAMMQNNNFVAQQYFFKSLELAKKSGFEDLSHRVRGNLLTLSHSMGDSIAFEIATEVYEYGVKEKNKEQISMGAYYLATYYYTQENFDKAEEYINTAIKTYNEYPYEDIASVYLLYAKVLIDRNLLDEAELTVKKAISLANKYNQVPIEIDAYIAHGEVEYRKKNYQSAIDIVKKAVEHAKSAGLTNKIIDCNQLMAHNYLAMNRVDEALVCTQNANTLLNEQATINMERLSHEQRVMRDIEQKEMEAKLKQEQIAAQRNIMILLGIVVLILLALLVVIISSYRKRHKLYKSIVLQNSRSIAKQKELQQQIDYLYKEKELIEKEMKDKELVEQNAQKRQDEEGVPASAKKSSFAMSDDKMEGLYTDLCQLMEKEYLYKEAQLTREKMAERLGTNRTYLIKVIKEKTNMNYLQFVNSYRINEAIKILSDKDKVNYPLKQIWSDLGFSSPSTFFKLFQQAVGITPSVYRKQFIETNSSKEEVDDDDDYII